MHFDIRLITQEGNADAGFIYFSTQMNVYANPTI